MFLLAAYWGPQRGEEVCNLGLLGIIGVSTSNHAQHTVSQVTSMQWCC